MNYAPKPIDTSNVELNDEILGLLELLARNSHDVWALKRIHEGWKYGPRRNDKKKEHPNLIPYEDLKESEKEYDREIAMNVLKAIKTLGYQIIKF